MRFPQILVTCDHFQSNFPPTSNLYNLSAATGSFLAFNVSPHDQSSNRNAEVQWGFIEDELLQYVCVCVFQSHNNNIQYTAIIYNNWA